MDVAVPGLSRPPALSIACDDDFNDGFVVNVFGSGDFDCTDAASCIDGRA